ncbi:MAG: phenylalanine--tRNA ligase subunit beta, partial [Candidatus Saccharimonadales bacterium]
RFMMQVVKNVKVNDASLDIRSYLARVGMRPINNIVDTTNYLMYETAQPIHAYDYDKVKSLSGQGGAKIIVREAKKGEKLALLAGKTVTLAGGELVIATDKQPIGLAGVMGGADTEVDEKTKSIILEVGNFDMRITRRTAMNYGLFTDAATRFTKNQSPWQTDRVLARAVDFILHQSGGLPARSIYDLKGTLNTPSPVKTTAGFVNKRLGLSLSSKAMSKLLENVEFKVQASGENLIIGVPFWRTDIKIAEDIVEEVGRLYGYQHLPIELPSRDLSPAKPDPMLSFKSQLRNIMSSAGANEVLTYSFVDEPLLRAVGQDPKDAYHIRNALSPDLQYYRLSLTPSLLEKAHPNVKARFDRFALFEIGAAHVRGVEDSEKLPAELLRLGIAIVSTSKPKEAKAPFYKAKYYVDKLLNKLSISDVEYWPLEQAKNQTKDWRVASKAFEPKRSAALYAGKDFLGVVGEPSAKLRATLKLPLDSAAAELSISAMQLLSAARVDYRPLNRFPSLDQDLCLSSSIEITYADLSEFLKNHLDKAAKEHGYSFAIEPLDIFQRPKDKSHKQTTWRISLWHPQRTLTTTEVNQLFNKIAVAARKELAAERI